MNKIKAILDDSCNPSLVAGADPRGFAQNLANKLNVVVEAPTKMVWAYPNGKYFVAAMKKDGSRQPDMSNRGKFIKFYPGGKKK